MRDGRGIFGLHAAGAVLALTAALVWPRAGQAALMVPLGAADTRTVLGWAAQEDAPLLVLDTASGRVVARMPDNRSMLRALGHGIVPVAAPASGCRADTRR